MSAKPARADAARRYLLTIGVDSHTEFGDDGVVIHRFACGCRIATRLMAVCERHRGALLGRDASTGEYGSLEGQ